MVVLRLVCNEKMNGLKFLPIKELDGGAKIFFLNDPTFFPTFFWHKKEGLRIFRGKTRVGSFPGKIIEGLRVFQRKKKDGYKFFQKK